MNLWFRLIRVWRTARQRDRLGPHDTSVIQIRVWPNDLDLWAHVNGGRYLTLSDLGRLDLAVRTGLFTLVRRNGWTMPMGSAALRFRRPLRLFNTCELHTRILGWEDKWAYLETRFIRHDQTVAVVVAKAVVRGRDGNIAPLELTAMLGVTGDPPVVPDHIRCWVDTDAVLR